MDIGAFKYVPGIAVDITGDGLVEDFDLSILLANWNRDVGAEKGNLNGDDIVDDKDLSLLLANWAGTATQGGGTGASSWATAERDGAIAAGRSGVGGESGGCQAVGGIVSLGGSEVPADKHTAAAGGGELNLLLTPRGRRVSWRKARPGDADRTDDEELGLLLNDWRLGVGL